MRDGRAARYRPPDFASLIRATVLRKKKAGALPLPPPAGFVAPAPRSSMDLLEAGLKSGSRSTLGGFPLGLDAVVLDHAFQRIAVELAEILRVAGGKADLVAEHLARSYGHGRGRGLHRAGQHLVALFEPDFAVRQLPGAFDLGRDHPVIGAAILATVEALDVQVGRPVAHAEGVRHDASARLHVQDGRAQLQ